MEQPETVDLEAFAALDRAAAKITPPIKRQDVFAGLNVREALPLEGPKNSQIILGGNIRLAVDGGRWLGGQGSLHFRP